MNTLEVTLKIPLDPRRSLIPWMAVGLTGKQQRVKELLTAAEVEPLEAIRFVTCVGDDGLWAPVLHSDQEHVDQIGEAFTAAGVKLAVGVEQVVKSNRLQANQG